jgi:hypothetical protein
MKKEILNLVGLIFFGCGNPDYATPEKTLEPAGPSSTKVESSEIDEDKGEATLVVDGKEVYFVKEGGDWKLDGFFGVVEDLEQQYPTIKE